MAIKNQSYKVKNGGGNSNSKVPNQAPRNIVDRTFDFAVRIVTLSHHLDEKPGVGRTMMSQILRAGTSVPANVEEAQAAQSRADFVNKMNIALKEARETHLRLRLLAAAEVTDAKRLEPLLQEADELKRIIGAIIVSTKRKTSP
jgi:four helix bundle protein